MSYEVKAAELNGRWVVISEYGATHAHITTVDGSWAWRFEGKSEWFPCESFELATQAAVRACEARSGERSALAPQRAWDAAAAAYTAKVEVAYIQLKSVLSDQDLFLRARAFCSDQGRREVETIRYMCATLSTGFDLETATIIVTQALCTEVPERYLQLVFSRTVVRGNIIHRLQKLDGRPWKEYVEDVIAKEGEGVARAYITELENVGYITLNEKGEVHLCQESV